jgi:hypothetical protein
MYRERSLKLRIFEFLWFSSIPTDKLRDDALYTIVRSSNAIEFITDIIVKEATNKINKTTRRIGAGIDK